jgi:hypothetical protein
MLADIKKNCSTNTHTHTHTHTHISETKKTEGVSQRKRNPGDVSFDLFLVLRLFDKFR